MDLRVDGKVALVTGSDSGIGRGIALRLAEAGADVTICYHTDRDGGQQTAEACQAFGRQTLVVQGDVGNPADVEHIFQQHDETFDRIDILVNTPPLAMVRRSSTNRWPNSNAPFAPTSSDPTSSSSRQRAG